jgi:hypothetical protein
MRYPFDLSNKDVATLGAAFVLVLSTATAAVAQAAGSDTQSVVATNSSISEPVRDAIVIRTTPTLRAIEEKEMKILMEKKSSSGVKKLAINPLAEFENRRKPLEPTELRDLLYGVGFRGKALEVAWGIVMRESRGGPTAHNGNANTGDNSYGLFQINMIGGLGEDRREKFGLKTNEELFDPITNARIAFHMSGGGEDFGAWGVGPNAYNGGKVGDLYTWVAKFPKD